jgi:hypothetical protein
MTFSRKRESVHLEFLARLFDVLPLADLDAWLADEPTGQYFRRTGFLYEWLTENRLGFGGVSNYIDALDSNLSLIATNPENVPRWRVRNNLPGIRGYCPMVFRTDAVRVAETYDCNQRLHDLDAEKSLARAGRMDTPSVARYPDQALETRNDDVSGIAGGEE